MGTELETKDPGGRNWESANDLSRTDIIRRENMIELEMTKRKHLILYIVRIQNSFSNNCLPIHIFYILYVINYKSLPFARIKVSKLP